MKFFFLTFFFSLSLWANSLPGNKLYSFDEALISKTDFRKTLQLAETLFQPLAQSFGRELLIVSIYEEEWVQAFAQRQEKDIIYVYGGMARYTGANLDSLGLTLCHELGHLYGGQPYVDQYNKVASEGQADYWSTSSDCLSKMYAVIHAQKPLAEAVEECATHSHQDFCIRSLTAALPLTGYFASSRNLALPQYKTPDSTVVETTLKIHPNPQCRLDTYKAGVFAEKRPSCWYKENQ